MTSPHRLCGHCEKDIAPLGDSAIYCSPRCGRRAGEKRRRQRRSAERAAVTGAVARVSPLTSKDFRGAPRPAPEPVIVERPKPKRRQEKRNLGTSLNEVGRCPRPYKQVFRTEGEAEAMIDIIGDESLHVYRCPCGALHIGHPTSQQMRKRAMSEYRAWANESSS